MIILKDVSKYYNLRNNKLIKALDSISITFEANKLTAIIGDSGSGKTTLLKSILGLIDVNEGRVIINGIEYGALECNEWNNYVNTMCSYVSQDYNLIPAYTCYDNIALGLINIKIEKEEIRKKIFEISDKLGIMNVLFKKISKLSGGQKQRCAIAQAIIKDTPIMILDELTSNIDEKYSNIIYKLLSELAKTKTIIIVTHDQNNVVDYCSNVLEIKKGKLVSSNNSDLHQNDIIDKQYEFSFIRKCSFVNIILLSIKNILLSSKNRLIPVALIVFSILFFTLSFSMVSSAIEKSNSYNTLFSNSTDGRLVVSKLDGNSFTESELDTILNIKCGKVDETQCIDTYMYNDFLLDYEFTLQHSFVKTSCLFSPLKSIEDEDIIQGRMPENENEIIIYNTSSFNIGDEVILSEGSISFYMVAKVVGKTNTSNSLVYLSEKKIEHILMLTESQRIYTSHISFTGVTSTNEVIEAQDNGIYYSSNIPREKLLLSYSFFYNDYLMDEMSVEERQQYTNDIKENFQNLEKAEIYLTDFYGNNVSYQFNDIEVVQGYHLFEINESLFYELFYNNQGYQISAFTSSKEKAVYLENEIEKLDNNYDVLIPSSVAVEFENLNDIKNFSIFLFVFVLSMLTFFLIIFTVMYTLKRKRRDEFQTFFFVGISRKRINAMVMIENFLMFLISIILAFIIVLFLNQIPQIRVISISILQLDIKLIIVIFIILLYFYIMIDYITSKIHNSNKYIK